jgi:peptidoglycan/xylan/chitin deacetylase (PgdA/CDA1 family)
MGLKRMVAATAVRLGAERMGRRLNPSAVPVLTYHNVLPPGVERSGDRSLHVDFDAFRRQMDHLQVAYDVVPPHAALGDPSSDKPRVAITFDDAYRGAVDTAFPELSARGLPATVFVAPGILGSRGMWWDALADPESGLRADVRDHAIHREDGDHERVMRWASSNGMTPCLVPEAFGIATEEELRAALASSVISVGAHSWGHLNLAGLDAHRLREELEPTRDHLAERFREWVPWLAYPYGLHSPRAVDAAATTGHDGAFIVGGGLMTQREPRHALPRVGIPAGVAEPVFRLMLAGLVS